MDKKSQSAVEFIVLGTFMLLVVVAFFAFTSSSAIDANEEGNRQTAEDIAELAYKEVEIAKAVNDGYIRLFNLPLTVSGGNYTINITDNIELLVSFFNKEHLLFLPANVTGNISKGKNVITRVDGEIILTSGSECNDGLDNDGDGDRDYGKDGGCSSKDDDDETNCGDLVCEGPETCLTCGDCPACPVQGNFFIEGLTRVFSIDENGNVVISGTFSQETNPVPDPVQDEFIIIGLNGNVVTMVNMNTGDMAISGELFDMQDPNSLNPLSNFDDLIFRDTNSRVVGYINDVGQFYIIGSLTENGNP
jgi:hypothetical protein